MLAGYLIVITIAQYLTVQVIWALVRQSRCLHPSFALVHLIAWLFWSSAITSVVLKAGLNVSVLALGLNLVAQAICILIDVIVIGMRRMSGLGERRQRRLPG